MMNAGIAYILAQAGVQTVLLDVSNEAPEKGKDYSHRLVDRLTAKSALERADGDALLSRIQTTDDYAALWGSDAVIETVFGDIQVKAEVTRKVLPHLAPGILFSSNTSTLPIGLD
jgi:3-hydroxyacyl-CoA dehydrogenase / enoyl-CoA hydratase / 3-hydroxybutyryl-CoA epimerase